MNFWVEHPMKVISALNTQVKHISVETTWRERSDMTPNPFHP
jgi:hypothetical protein